MEQLGVMAAAGQYLPCLVKVKGRRVSGRTERNGSCVSREWRCRELRLVTMVADSRGDGDYLRVQEEPPEYFVSGKLLSEVSTWGIGGPAKYFVEVHEESQLVSTLRYCRRHDIRFFVVGKGSNCLFNDRGFDGCVLLNCLDFTEAAGDGVYRVGSGHPFNLLGIRSSKDGFTGLEFASGIPGTVGGAVFMNAGADGQETVDVLESVETLNADAERYVHTINTNTRSGYGYRISPFQKMTGFSCIVAATFRLKPCAEARDRQRAYLNRRKRTQPVTDRSAGCVFRNPYQNPDAEARSAGGLIEQAGLKGVSVSEAMVSEIHANFLCNLGGCTAADMRSLIKLVQEKVKQNSGVDLQEEIIYVPFN